MKMPPGPPRRPWGLLHGAVQHGLTYDLRMPGPQWARAARATAGDALRAAIDHFAGEGLHQSCWGMEVAPPAMGTAVNSIVFT